MLLNIIKMMIASQKSLIKLKGTEHKFRSANINKTEFMKSK